jgi:hypothetical protein
MNFSAQGYAALTERLKPDIAVLEGGYAIEGALPYVNLGIVLAMAGLDYSRVREPNYDPDAIRQGRRVTETIEKVCEAVMTRWEKRNEIQEAVRAARRYVDRSRNIFYDTDMLMEQQKERVRICDDCAGAVRIDSSSDRGWRILAVQIPRKACPACRSIAEEWFQNADSGIYRCAFLQDRERDKFTAAKF